MSTAPGRALYDAAAARAIDGAASAALGVVGDELMRRAGRAAWELVRARWPAARRLAIVCGTGNNGGDGMVVARLAQAAGRAVDLVLVGEPAALRGEAAAAWAALTGTPVARGAGLDRLATADLVIDALFGTGLARALAGHHAEAVAAINAARAPVLALDVPSGLDASSGAVLGVAVEAAATVSFIALKRGLVTGWGPELCGDLTLATLDVPASAYAAVAASAVAVGWDELRARLKPRARGAHKGHFGHVLVVGGAPGMSGAARLCAEAAARAGAGLVSVATHPEHAALLNATRPELMCHAVTAAAALRPLLERATVVALGPGLGRGAWSMMMFAAARAARVPLVVDADALNLLARDAERRADWVLTPHPGEAARLDGSSTDVIHADRYAAAARLQAAYGGVVVLKGAGSIVASADALPRVVTGGNPGMATGGMGDVLTGIIAALIAQGAALPEAALMGACVHACAGDRAARAGERGLLALDVIDELRALLNPPASA